MTEEDKPTAQRSIFAQWREGKVWHRHFLWLALRRMAFVLASAVAIWGHVAEASIPLTVKCRCERADADRDIVGKSGTLCAFVLDHSGTMGSLDATSVKHGSTKVSRWTALKDSFEETVRSIPNGSKVQIYCVGGKKKRSGWGIEKIWDGMEARRIYVDPLPIRNSADRDKLVRDVFDWGDPTYGTPLYDALYQACEDVQNFSLAGGNSCVVVFSDGKDEHHSNKCKTLQNIRDRFAGGSAESVGLFASDEFDACLTWIGSSSDSPVPVFGEKHLWTKTHEIPFVCRVAPSSRLYNNRNPLETGGQAEISNLTYLFPMSSERWQSMLKRGTVKPTLELSTADGAVLGSCVMDLGKAANAVFQLPDSVFADNKATTLKLNLLLPAKDGSCRFSKTVPVHVMFDKVGKVSITAIRPAGDVYVTSGTKVEFSAEATAGSTFTWNFGEGTSATGSSVSHVYTKINESGYPYSLTVSHGKMSPDTRGGKIYVVDAGVAFSDLPKNATEGVECALTCKAWKDVSSVTWYVDGVCYRGTEQKVGRDTISILRHTFDAAREYKVQARANVQRIGECSTEVAKINVAAKPYARIVAPGTANEKFDAGEDVEFASRVSGVVSGKWRFADKAGKVVAEVDATISPDKPTTAAKQSFVDGGEYVVSFVGKTATGADIQSEALPFRINPRVVRIEIASPTADEEIKTDVAFKLCAKNVKGVEGAIQWFLSDANHENEKALGESEVSADGTGEKSINFKSAEYGEGSFYLVARSVDGKASSKPLPITLHTQARISIVHPANGETTAFDGRMTFSAKIESEGDVLKSDSVRWIVQRVGGSPEQAGTKESCSYQFRRIPKVSSVSYSVRAEATLPSGRIVQSDDERTVVAYCPAIQASITQPQVNGVVLASIGKQVDYTVSLKVADGDEVADVVWDMGDGASYTNLTSVKHAYLEYGTYQIRATGRCAKCGDAFAIAAPSRLVVEKQPISAAFTIRASATSPKAISGTVAQGRQVTLIGQASPDIARREWTCNGQIILGDDGKPKQGSSIEYRCKDVGEYVFGLTVYDDAGSAVGPEKHALKTYRLWAILLIAFVCLIIWGVLVWYWQGDDPRFWTALVRIDRDGNTSFKDIKELQKRPRTIRLEDYWDMAGNIAKLSMVELTRRLRDVGDWNSKTGVGNGEITIKAGEKNGKLIAVVEKLHGDFEVRPEDHTDSGSAFRVIADSPDNPSVVLEIKRNIGNKTHVLYIALSFIGLSLAAVGLSAWLAF